MKDGSRVKSNAKKKVSVPVVARKHNAKVGKNEMKFIDKTDLEVFPREIAAKFLADDKQVIRGKPIINREEYLSTTLNSIGDGVISTDSKGNVVQMNPVAERWCGFTHEEAIGKPLQKIFRIVNQHTRKLVKNPVDRVLKTGKIVGLANHTILISKDGTERQIADSAAPIIDKKGNIHGVVLVFSDVTEDYAIHEKLQRSEEQYRLLIQTMEQGLAVHEIICNDKGKPIDYIFLDVNSSYEKLTGFIRENIIGKTVREVLPDVEEYWIENYGKVALTGKSMHFENFAKGLNKYYRVIAYSPKQNRFAVLVEDVTERKNAERYLRESELRYRTISRLSSDFSFSCVHMAEEGYNVDWITDAFFTITGYDEEELKQKKCWMFTLHKDDYSWMMNKLNDLQESEITEDEFRIVSIEGRVYWVYQWLECVKDESAPGKKRIFGAVQNITERKNAEALLKESEEKYRAIAENSFDLIYIMSFDGVFSYVSSACERILGYRHDELVGTRFLEMIDEKNLSKVIKLFESTKLSNNPGVQVEAKKKDGTEIILEINSQVNFKNGVPFNMQGFARDITEKRRAEEEREITLKLFSIINTQNNFYKLIEEIAQLLKEWINCDAIGIRLKDGVDYPYYVTIGFDEAFVNSEKYLCFKDNKGEILIGEDKKPMLHCICGNIINGNADTSLPFFTNNGSFWTNNSTAILNELNNHNSIIGIRGRCISEHYESLALIPLRTVETVYGLVQLNAKNRNMFTREKISLIERLANNISISLAHKKAQEELKESEFKYRTLFETMVQGVVYLDKDGKIIEANIAAEKILGLTYNELIGRYSADERWYTIKEDMSPFSEEEHPAMVALKTGKEIKNKVMGVFNPIQNKYHWININAVPQFKNGELFPNQVFVTFEDITESRNAGQKIYDSLKEKEILLKEIHHRVKNNFQIVNSLLSLQADVIEDRNLVNVFSESQNRIRSMSLIHELMYKSGNFTSVDFKDYLESLIGYLKLSYTSKRNAIEFNLDIDEVNLDMDTVISCGLLLNEIISNSIKHAFLDNSVGTIGVSLKEISKCEYLLRINDNGIGIPEVQNKDSHKTLGMQLISTLVKQLKADLKISSPGVGTEYIITFKKEQSL
ncbi:MAG: PAS domain S-box protein [bacterium]